MTNRFVRFLLLAVLIAIANTVVAQEHRSPDQASLRRLLQQAAKESPHFSDIPTSVISSKAFSDLWKKADRYALVAIPLLSDPSIPAEQKQILARGVQNASFENMLVIWEGAYGAWEQAKIRSELLEVVLFPGYDWSVKLQENYQDGRARSFLEKVRLSKLYSGRPERLKYVEDVISGKAAADVQQLRKDGQLLKR